MRMRAKLYALWVKKRPKSLSATKIIAITFAVIILIGAGLLCLPAASRDGVSCGFLPALFTATSATCVTGLVLYDTFSQWSGFGQVVIISLIEIGGLGFMSAATVFVFLLRRRIGLKQRLLMAQALSVSDMDGIVKLQKTVLVGSLLVEGIGALVLLLRFWPEYGFLTAVKWGLFHSISAFCNAGFDIFGCITPGASLMGFQSDPIVLLTLGVLITVGGLGFLVWQEVWEKRSPAKFTVYTRLVLSATGILILMGWAGICLLEWNNPATLGPMSLGDKLLNGLFQSLTLRTAGFAAIDQGALTEAGKGFSMILMLIGGSSGSTAGGVKTVTFLVIVLFIWTRIRGKEQVTVYKRTLQRSQIMDAMTIVFVVAFLALAGALFISATSPVTFVDSLYESVSALATVGLTAGATGSLSLPAKLLVIVYMYFGRVGVLTISMGFLVGDRVQERFHYAQTNLLIG